MSASPFTADTDKAALRALALHRRDALPVAARIEAALALRDHFPFERFDWRGKIVSGFLPIQSELDLRPLMDALRARGARLALPAFIGKHMLFRAFEREAPLVPMGFGTYGPGEEAAEVEPDILLTPLAAFDRVGNRIGYGKGHYDKALARLDAKARRIAIGTAFAVQEMAAIPAEAHDRPLDMVVTEREVIAMQPHSGDL